MKEFTATWKKDRRYQYLSWAEAEAGLREGWRARRQWWAQEDQDCDFTRYLQMTFEGPERPGLYLRAGTRRRLWSAKTHPEDTSARDWRLISAPDEPWVIVPKRILAANINLDQVNMAPFTCSTR
ncbi:MAG TPA: hypothetical protein VD994_07110 [Prosthecobacter sp.]|nr:hypothetical protein [Prosthecobacter sp.]